MLRVHGGMETELKKAKIPTASWDKCMTLCVRFCAASVSNDKLVEMRDQICARPPSTAFKTPLPRGDLIRVR